MTLEDDVYEKEMGHAWATTNLQAAAIATARPFVHALRDFGQDQLGKLLISVPSAPNLSFNAIVHRGQASQILARLRERRDSCELAPRQRVVLDRQIQKLENRVQREAPRRRGRVPSEKTLRRSLVVRAIRRLEGEIAARCEAIYQLGKRNGALGPLEVNTLDSTYVPSCGQAREQYRYKRKREARIRRGQDPGDPPWPLGTQAAVEAQVMPPDEYRSTEVGYQYHLLATHGKSGQHYLRKVLRRRMGFAENPQQVVKAFLEDLDGSPRTWNLADKWFSSAGAIGEFEQHAARTGSKYLVPVPRSDGGRKLRSVKEITPDDLKWNRRGIRFEAQLHWEKAQPVEGTWNDHFVVYPRRVSLDSDVVSNLFIYYRSPGKTSKGAPKEPEWDKTESYIAFYTNAEVNAENALWVVERYRLRWQIENFIKDVKHWTSIAPTQGMFGRDLTFFLGLALLSLHSLFRDRFRDLDPEFDSLPMDKATFFFVLQVVLFDLIPAE